MVTVSPRRNGKTSEAVSILRKDPSLRLMTNVLLYVPRYVPDGYSRGWKIRGVPKRAYRRHRRLPKKYVRCVMFLPAAVGAKLLELGAAPYGAGEVKTY